ncbi:hypothetical protein CC2G_015111 [Coprinopsis cinerea AmutBmut pab1-1]|nr:hypothetical protein CC2G_015111 [Coprinopsis cinerea AmutBmut pab1-1]
MVDYYEQKAPFTGEKTDGLAYWERQNLPAEQYPIKTLAIWILSILPHAAEVECLFSNLSGVQGLRHCNLAVSTFETLGKLRANYRRILWSRAKAMGKSTQRKHTHMHTREGGGIDETLVDEIEGELEPAGSPDDEAVLAGHVEITTDKIERAYTELDQDSRAPIPTAWEAETEGCTISVDLAFDLSEFASCMHRGGYARS